MVLVDAGGTGLALDSAEVARAAEVVAAVVTGRGG
jgi:hypothetical protein